MRTKWLLLGATLSLLAATPASATGPVGSSTRPTSMPAGGLSGAPAPIVRLSLREIVQRAVAMSPAAAAGGGPPRAAPPTAPPAARRAALRVSLIHL